MSSCHNMSRVLPSAGSHLDQEKSAPRIRMYLLIPSHERRYRQNVDFSRMHVTRKNNDVQRVCDASTRPLRRELEDVREKSNLFPMDNHE